MPERPLAVVPAWRWWTGFFVIAGSAGYLTLMAYREGLPAIFAMVPSFDKLVHFSAAGLLAFFLDGALARRTAFTLRGANVPLAAMAVLVPAGTEEYLQRYSAYRTSSIWDFVADVLGVVVWIALSRRVAR